MSKPSYIIATDLHLTSANLAEKRDIVEQLINLCKKKEVNVVVLMGDIFTSRSSQRLDVLLMWKQLVETFTQNDIFVYAIAGNHDKTNLKALESYLDLYDGSHFHVFREGDVIDHDNITLCFLPYFLENDGTYRTHLNRLLEKLKSAKYGEFCFLHTHVAVNDAKTNGGKRIENELKKDLFDVFDKTFVGHFHNRTRLGNIIYVGSTNPSNFGEDNEKGFVIVYTDGNHEFHKPNFTHYEKIDIDLNKVDVDDIIRLAERYSKVDDNVRFVLHGSPEDIKKVNTRVLKELGIDVKVKNTEIEVGQADEVDIANVRYDGKTLLKEFILFSKGRDKNMMKKGMQLIKTHVDA